MKYNISITRCDVLYNLPGYYFNYAGNMEVVEYDPDSQVKVVILNVLYTFIRIYNKIVF